MALPIALTMGDPAGIGPELTRRVWDNLKGSGRVFFWIGDPALLGADTPYREIQHPSEAVACFSDSLPVLPLSCPEPVYPGRPSPGNAVAVIESIRKAVHYTLEGDAGAVVTNPIAKHVLAASGFPHPGHTEFLAALCGASGQEIMMLACPELKVTLTSIHIPLKKAIDTLSVERIVAVTRVTAAALRRDFGLSQPRLAIAGLNPHAGENGMMGDEEKRIIRPAVEALRREGINVIGPMPPDTMFSAAARPRYDAAVCLYHDQGLIPVKTLDMAGGVNVTLGLPIIRTSPDHGTAFDIAVGPGETGQASISSLLSALAMAHDMALQRVVTDAQNL
ncbi:4-hydroxythreonine-4-phosphate dehydrogenase PdxA [Acetobacteraceae bacterium B3987]|nr:4-hydroxythreonine-4-phosphate dehydrogenase PdxA [Acetobacteraceae bacterium B3987]